MPQVNITITNIAQIKHAFGVAPMEMTKQLDIAIKKTLFRIQASGSPKTPVLTGRLRASWYSKFGNLRGETGTNTNYDVFVHEGTRFMTGRPYLKDAVEDTNTETEQDFKAAVQNTLDKIAGMV